MPEQMIHPDLVRFTLEAREIELERKMRRQPDLQRARRRPAIAWRAVPAIIRGWLFPAPPFGAERLARLEAAPNRLR